jgi:general secretion pathway protein J
MSRSAGTFRRPAGFTLVELLLALTLMSMLLALAYGGLRASTRAAEKGQQVLEDSSRIRMAHQFVRKQLNQLLPLAWEVGEQEGERVMFYGDARRIRFVAPMPGYLGFGGPQVQELEFVPGEEGYDLVLSHALLQNFEEEYLYQREPIFLLGDIQNASFSFLGVDENGELTDWMPSWENVATLPVSVSLEIEFNEDVYIQWPLLAASVRSDPMGMRGADVEESAYSTTIRKMLQRSGKKQ